MASTYTSCVVLMASSYDIKTRGNQQSRQSKTGSNQSHVSKQTVGEEQLAWLRGH
jgi:hypothetical protein